MPRDALQVDDQRPTVLAQRRDALQGRGRRVSVTLGDEHASEAHQRGDRAGLGLDRRLVRLASGGVGGALQHDATDDVQHDRVDRLLAWLRRGEPRLRLGHLTAEQQRQGLSGRDLLRQGAARTRLFHCGVEPARGLAAVEDGEDRHLHGAHARLAGARRLGEHAAGERGRAVELGRPRREHRHDREIDQRAVESTSFAPARRDETAGAERRRERDAPDDPGATGDRRLFLACRHVRHLRRGRGRREARGDRVPCAGVSPPVSGAAGWSESLPRIPGGGKLVPARVRAGVGGRAETPARGGTEPSFRPSTIPRTSWTIGVFMSERPRRRTASGSAGSPRIFRASRATVSAPFASCSRVRTRASVRTSSTATSGCNVSARSNAMTEPRASPMRRSTSPRSSWMRSSSGNVRFIWRSCSCASARLPERSSIVATAIRSAGSSVKRSSSFRAAARMLSRSSALRGLRDIALQRFTPSCTSPTSTNWIRVSSMSGTGRVERCAGPAPRSRSVGGIGPRCPGQGSEIDRRKADPVVDGDCPCDAGRASLDRDAVEEPKTRVRSLPAGAARLRSAANGAS